MSLLTEAEKAEIQAELQSVRDTFSREIYVYVKTVTKKPSSVLPDYNALYGRGKNSQKNIHTGESLTKYAFNATIQYINAQLEDSMDERGQFNLDSSEGSVVIKVSKEACDKIKIASRIEIDDELYIMLEDPKKIGPFSPQAYRIRLKREN